MSCALFAQSEEGIVNVSFRALSWDNTIPKVEYFDGTEVASFLVPNGSRSVVQHYTGPATITFYDTLRFGPDNAPIYPPVAFASIPPDIQSPLFLFIKNADGDDYPYKVLVVDESAQNFPNGSYRFFNLTQYNLACLFGKNKFQLKPGSQETLSTEEAEKKYVEIKLARNDERTEGWRLAYASKWGIRKNRRALVFLYSKPDDPSEIITKKYYDNGPAPQGSVHVQLEH
ncbi:hypothetical protein [Rubellicoccus peritrichatus]|uniref:Uncharacterized protein n=1 Tax=Rubellicoccus peritrichatus TaxID=3080537 RepID=A0AAQ3LCU6_9BACT|nr:hypothetical protein [Puniceicoccus sp. CR14]WOO41545.1 hypothetical protein RZN69_00490 [Puniceicoccus sp. CR14]